LSNVDRRGRADAPAASVTIAKENAAAPIRRMTLVMELPLCRYGWDRHGLGGTRGPGQFLP
jgi:hypothetical protein